MKKFLPFKKKIFQEPVFCMNTEEPFFFQVPNYFELVLSGTADIPDTSSRGNRGWTAVIIPAGPVLRAMNNSAVVIAVLF